MFTSVPTIYGPNFLCFGVIGTDRVLTMEFLSKTTETGTHLHMKSGRTSS